VEEQRIILGQRTSELYQTETEEMARLTRSLIDGERHAFNDTVRRLLAKEGPQKLANNFSSALASEWPRKSIGFALGDRGQLCSPTPKGAATNPTWGKFLLGNGGWLSGTTPATVYWVSGEDLIRSKGGGKTGADQPLSATNTYTGNVTGRGGNTLQMNGAQYPQVDLNFNNNPAEPLSQNAQRAQGKPQGRNQKALQNDNNEVKLQEQQSAGQNLNEDQYALNKQQDNYNRTVAPYVNNSVAVSQLAPATADFLALTSDTNEGVITRFVQDQLDIIFWLRPAQAPDMVFGCLIESENLRDLWPSILPLRGNDYPDSNSKFSRSDKPEFVLALLDDKARPIVTNPPGETGRDWKHPFVASEIGEALPHWEAALYLQRPEQLDETASALRRTLTFLVVTALGAIACGGWLVVADARRQMALAQQKTDFVSNVSHELKTPLTSIRMFAELMQNGKTISTDKHPQYLRIIMVEAERLTRLINNVLDFAGPERRQKRIDKKHIDLHEVIARTWEGQELHLQESGFTTRWTAAPAPYPVIGDEDALAQILVNLLSNAEKYAGERKEVELHTYIDGEHVCVSVLDRGSGVRPGEEQKIFEAFYRAHDSLSSGIQGSGLGLTLAQRLAHEHDGEITVTRREGGGSNFTLRLPLAKVAAS
jgi:signal transduction histidine kinase